MAVTPASARFHAACLAPGLNAPGSRWFRTFARAAAVEVHASAAGAPSTYRHPDGQCAPRLNVPDHGPHRRPAREDVSVARDSRGSENGIRRPRGPVGRGRPQCRARPGIHCRSTDTEEFMEERSRRHRAFPASMVMFQTSSVARRSRRPGQRDVARLTDPVRRSQHSPGQQVRSPSSVSWRPEVEVNRPLNTMLMESTPRCAIGIDGHHARWCGAVHSEHEACRAAAQATPRGQRVHARAGASTVPTSPPRQSVPRCFRSPTPRPTPPYT